MPLRSRPPSDRRGHVEGRTSPDLASLHYTLAETSQASQVSLRKDLPRACIARSSVLHKVRDTRGSSQRSSTLHVHTQHILGFTTWSQVVDNSTSLIPVSCSPCLSRCTDHSLVADHRAKVRDPVDGISWFERGTVDAILSKERSLTQAPFDI